jgi:AcrR family transcriptional regulator
MATRGDRTREHLLDVAERLFGAEGVAHVSLRQIRIAAGQANEGAVQYHFGDRDGVLRALAERHSTRIEDIRVGLDAHLGRRRSMRQLVELLIRPLADYGHQGPGARAWIRIVAELTTDPRLSLAQLHQRASPLAAAVGEELVDRLSNRMPRDVAVARVWTTAQFHLHICADRARLADDPGAARHLADDEAFVRNLVDMAVGALTAPASVPRPVT